MAIRHYANFRLTFVPSSNRYQKVLVLDTSKQIIVTGKTGKFFFGKDGLKAKSPQTSERDPIKCVILDVGGERYTAQRNSLLKYPTTRLGKLMRSATISGGQ